MTIGAVNLSIAILYFGLPKVDATVISESNLNSCIRRDDGKIKCEGKVVLSVSLGGTGISDDSQSIIITRVKGPDGMLEIEKPVYLQLMKSKSILRYSLVNVLTVNGNPWEQVFQTSGTGCSDDPHLPANELTCNPYVFSGNNTRIPDSQGFCCRCSVMGIGGPGTLFRSGVKCSLSGWFKDSGAAAHCLRWGSLYYTLYDILEPIIDYSLDILSSKGDRLQIAAGTRQGALVLDEVGEIRVRVEGELKGSTEIRNLYKSAYVAVPVDPDNEEWSTLQDLTEDRSNVHINDMIGRYGMLIPYSMVDLSGKTCNKIGVGHSAFRPQSSRCESLHGSCIANQLVDLWMNEKYNYEIPQGVCGGVRGHLYEINRLGSLEIVCNIEQSQNTVIVLELDAVSLSFISDVSDGYFTGMCLFGEHLMHIDTSGVGVVSFSATELQCVPPLTQGDSESTEISDPSKTTEDDGSATSQLASQQYFFGDILPQSIYLISLSVLNNGTMTSEFAVDTRCDVACDSCEGRISFPHGSSSLISIGAQKSSEVSLQFIASIDNQGDTPRTSECISILTNSRGENTGNNAHFSFNIRSVSSITNLTDSQGNEIVITLPDGTNSIDEHIEILDVSVEKSCKTECSSMVNIICQFQHNCFVLDDFLGISVVIGALLSLAALHRFGLLKRIVKIFLSIIRRKKKSHENATDNRNPRNSEHTVAANIIHGTSPKNNHLHVDRHRRLCSRDNILSKYHDSTYETLGLNPIRARQSIWERFTELATSHLKSGAKPKMESYREPTAVHNWVQHRDPVPIKPTRPRNLREDDASKQGAESRNFLKEQEYRNNQTKMNLYNQLVGKLDRKNQKERVKKKRPKNLVDA